MGVGDWRIGVDAGGWRIGADAGGWCTAADGVVVAGLRPEVGFSCTELGLRGFSPWGEAEELSGISAEVFDGVEPISGEGVSGIKLNVPVQIPHLLKQTCKNLKTLGIFVALW